MWFELAIERQRATAHPGSDGDVAALENAGLLSRRRQIEAHHVIEVAAVENENAGAIVYARARIRGRDEAAQHRRDAFGIDRELEPGQRLLRRPVALTGLQVEQSLGIDGDGIGLHRRRGGHSAGNDLALHQQALNARIDQAGSELREIENADHEREQPRHVEKNDAPAQARKSDADKEMPALQQEDGKAPSPSFRERCPVLALLLFQLDLEAFQRFIESAKAQRSCAGKELPAFGDEFAEAAQPYDRERQWTLVGTLRLDGCREVVRRAIVPSDSDEERRAVLPPRRALQGGFCKRQEAVKATPGVEHEEAKAPAFGQ